MVNSAPQVFPKGTNSVAWTATDSCGNSATCTQNVMVVDNQAPVMSCPGNIFTNATDPSGVVVTFSSSAVDNCDGSVPVNCIPTSGTTFGLGKTQVNCATVDSSGNTGSCLFDVTIGLDSASFRIISIVSQDDNIILTWIMPLGFTGIVQATTGQVNGGFSNSFADISTSVFVPGSGLVTTNYTDLGAATNDPARYYRVRLLP